MLQDPITNITNIGEALYYGVIKSTMVGLLLSYLIKAKNTEQTCWIYSWYLLYCMCT